jgi:hypothetical protein
MKRELVCGNAQHERMALKAKKKKRKKEIGP